MVSRCLDFEHTSEFVHVANRGNHKYKCSTLLVFRGVGGGVSAQLLFWIKFCKLSRVMFCVMNVS